MARHYGDYNTSDVVYMTETLYRPSTGAPYTLAGTPAVSVYKDDNATESTAGVTLVTDFDSRTGLLSIKIDTSADGAFYATAHTFSAVVTAGTVDSVSAVGIVLGSFSLGLGTFLKPATAGRKLVVDASGLADANVVKLGPTGSGTAQTARDIGASVLLSAGTGTGQLDFTSGVVKANATQWLGGTIPAVNVTGVPIVDLKYTLGTISPATAGSVRADVVTGAVGSVTGAVGSVTGNVGGNVNGNVVGSVASVTAGVSLAAGAITSTAVASSGLNAIADATWGRDMSAISRPGGSTRYPLQAIDFARNKVDATVSPAIVYEHDDSTVSYHLTLTTDAAANPVTKQVPS